MKVRAVVIKTKEMLNRMKHLLRNVFEKNQDKPMPVPAGIVRNRRNGMRLDTDKMNDRGAVHGIGFIRKHF